MVALDRPGDLRRHELQDLLLALPVPNARGVGLDREHTDGAVANLQRNTDPIDRRCPDQLDLTPPFQLSLDLRRDQERLARPQHVLGESLAEPLRREVGVDLIHEVREGQKIRGGVVQRDVEILRQHQLAHDLMDDRPQFLQAGSAQRDLRDAIGRGLQLMGSCLLFAAALGTERSQHRRTEALQVVLDDVVRRPPLQVLYGRLVSQPPGHNDHRRAGRELLGDLYGVPSPEVRERVIGDDHVRGELPERRDHAVSRVDPAERAENVGAADLSFRQLGV